MCMQLFCKLQHMSTTDCRAVGARTCTMTILLLIIFASLISCNKVDLDCIHENEECQILYDRSQVQPENLLRTIMGVSTVEKCLELCRTEKTNVNGQTCHAFTYFGAESFPFRAACMLFSHCKKRRPCQDCTTGSSETECTCSINYSSVISSNNFINDISIAEDELACKRRCAANEICKVINTT